MTSFLYLTRAYAECSETIEHLEFLFETKSLKDEELFKSLRELYETLSKKIFRFNQSVDEGHDKPYYVRENEPPYEPGDPNA